MYKILGEAICMQDGRPVLGLSYCPSNRKREFLEKICRWMNEEEIAKESQNFANLAHQMAVREELEEDDPDFVECVA